MLSTVEAVDPIFLSERPVERDHDCVEDTADCEMPDVFVSNLEGTVGGVVATKIVLVTLGLFSIVKIERQVQMLIPACDFCIPDKECTGSTGDLCELFRTIKFPTDEFFPPRFCEISENEVQPECGWRDRDRR